VPVARTFDFALIVGQAVGRRAVGFLQSAKDPSLDGGQKFRELKSAREREVRSRLDYWIAGGTNNRWFHGWPDLTKYKECFTFKWKENRQHQRLYGFLHHPKPKTAPRFVVCVLVYHDEKNEDETDFSILDRLNELRKDSSVVQAINSLFPEERSSKQKWVQ